jgi:hypothetical protein
VAIRCRMERQARLSQIPNVAHDALVIPTNAVEADG